MKFDRKKTHSFAVVEPRERYGLSRERPLKVSCATGLRLMTLARPHMHEELELGIVLAGRSLREHDGRQREYGPGDVWLCSSGETHSSTVLEVPYSKLNVMIWPPLLAELHVPETPSIPWSMPFHVAQERRPVTREEDRPHLLQLAMNVAGAACASRMTMQASVRMAFLQLLLFLIEKWPQKEDALSLGRAELEGLKPALDAGRTARRLITAEEAASLCGLSVNGFNNKFRRQMGCSFAEWALRRRFGGAARALTSTDAPVSDIAADWGFTDASHLHRVLQRFTGCTPRQYRQRYAAGYPSPPGRQRGYE